MKNGVNNIADLLEAEMDLGLVNMAAYKWSSCGVVQLISNLTSNHSTFTSSITSASPSGGGTYVNTALDDALTNYLVLIVNLQLKKQLLS